MSGQLSVASDGARSVVVSARAGSPLTLLSPRNHGHAAWVYQSSHGGGFVGADDVQLAVDVAPQATLFLSSQASSKVYRAARSSYTLHATVGAGATLVSWPDPVVCFAGAAFAQRQHFAVDETANLVCVDAWTAGRVARGERWAFESLQSRITVEIGGKRSFHDAVLLSPAAGPLDLRMGPFTALATVVLAGPSLQRSCDEAAAHLAAAPLGLPLVVASRWPWGLVVRVGAVGAESLSATLRALLGGPVTTLLGDDPWARKW